MDVCCCGTVKYNDILVIMDPPPNPPTPPRVFCPGLPRNWVVVQWSTHALNLLRYINLSKFLGLKTIYTEEEAGARGKGRLVVLLLKYLEMSGVHVRCGGAQKNPNSNQNRGHQGRVLGFCKV